MATLVDAWRNRDSAPNRPGQAGWSSDPAGLLGELNGDIDRPFSDTDSDSSIDQPGVIPSHTPGGPWAFWRRHNENDLGRALTVVTSLAALA